VVVVTPAAAVVVVGAGSVVGGTVLDVTVLDVTVLDVTVLDVTVLEAVFVPDEVEELPPTLTGWPPAPHPARKAARPIAVATSG
jgi:hypothetical protein